MSVRNAVTLTTSASVAPAAAEHRRQVVEDLGRLLLDRVAGELAGRRVDPDLARGEHELPARIPCE